MLPPPRRFCKLSSRLVLKFAFHRGQLNVEFVDVLFPVDSSCALSALCIIDVVLAIASGRLYVD